MDDLGLAAVLAFFTFVLVGAITFTVVARVQHLRDGIALVEKDWS